MRTAATVLAALCAALLAHAAGAQEPAGGKDPAPKKPDRLAEWPELKSEERDLVRALVKQFRKAEDLHADASRKITALGAGAAPVLIPLVSDRQDNVNEQLFGILDQVVDARHAALLARETGRKSAAWRRYAMRRMCTFGDAELAPVFATAAKDEDEDVAFCAALGLLALGRGDGLDTVLAAARQRWNEVGELCATALQPARSATNANLVLERIATARPTDQMAGLRLLRHLMVKDQGVVLRTYLQAADFTVKKEAINTARALHGEPPIEKLASFQAIEMAKQWLEKL